MDSLNYLVSTGDVIATFMGWFEDTAAGGATVFGFEDPAAGGANLFVEKNSKVMLKPTKGSAAFWVNLDSSHARVSSSAHLGCPVLKGSKWTLNKWIYSWDQWKDWPCKLEPNVDMSLFDGMAA